MFYQNVCLRDHKLRLENLGSVLERQQSVASMLNVQCCNTNMLMILCNKIKGLLRYGTELQYGTVRFSDKVRYGITHGIF